MTNKVSIPIEAQLDTSGVEQRLNAFGAKVAQANNVQFNPVSKTSIDDIALLTKRFEQLMRVHGELARRVKATGQGGKPMWDMDWGQLYPDHNSRSKQTRKAMEYVVGGNAFSAPSSAPPGPGPGGGSGGRQPPAPPRQPTMWDHTKEQGGRVVGAGLRAAGPVGGVVAQAGSTGMSAGFGAGLMGLMGGLAALGVGKLISSITEKISEAEANNVAMDKLKRTLGDVNVSFDALKAVVNGAGDGLKITYAEAGQLASQFVKLGNVTNEQYKTVADELEVGVGISKAFGVDNAQGVGMMGQMRGMGVTSNTQESRRFALLIGETIGRSGAFAKADEVMEAIGSYATMQTRNNMGAANVSGYAGMYSAMVGSGIPGMDPQGAANILGRVNSSLSAGGAFGEASQFFSNTIGSSMGLDPFQTQVLREGGAFATNDEAFGEGSAAKRYGMAGPSGDKTFLQSSLEKLRGQYGNNKGMLAQATANHLGINMRQAMAVLSVDPNKMGEMQKYGDMGKLSGSGIGNLSKALYGTDEDRKGLAASLKGRKDVSDGDKAAIDTAMNSGDSALQRETLAKMTAQYDQERTMGSDIRDSKAALDNIKVSLADKMVPIMNEMRLGIMYMAGVNKGMSPKDIMEAVIRAEGKDKVKAIDSGYEDSLKKNFGAIGQVKKEQRDLLEANQKKVAAGTMTVEEHQRQMAPLQAKERQLMEEDAKIRDRHTKALEEQAKAIEDNVKKMREASIEAEQASLTTGSIGAAGAGGGRGFTNPGMGGATGGGSGASGPALKAANGKDVDEAMKYFMDKGWTKEQSAGIVANLVGESQLNANAIGDGGKAKGVAQWHPDRRAAYERWSGKRFEDATREEQYGFVQHELTAGEDAGARRAGRMLKGAESADHAAKIFTTHFERPKYAAHDGAKRGALAEGFMRGKPVAKTPSVIPVEKGPDLPDLTPKREELPAGAAGGRGTVNPAHVTADDVTVRLVDDRTGKPMAPPVVAPTRVQNNFPMNRDR